MTLSLVLFNTVFTLASGFDVEKYVEKFVNKDFIISTADYFNFKFGNSDSKMTFPLLLLKQLSKIRHLMRVASYIPQRFWKKHFLSRMELPQITTKTLREILWFNYMEQMIFY